MCIYVSSAPTLLVQKRREKEEKDEGDVWQTAIGKNEGEWIKQIRNKYNK